MINITLKHTVRGIRPLCIFDHSLLVIKGYACYVCTLDFQKMEYIARLPQPFWKCLAIKSRILNRVLRLSPTKAIRISQTNFLIFSGSELWNLDIQKKKISLDFRIPKGRKLLNMTIVDMPNFDQMLVFGEYFSNPSKWPVSIWARSLKTGKWKNVHTFMQGEIEHIHSVVSDQLHDCLWILTGDFGISPGIWKVTENFKKVQPIFRGDQQFRAAWMVCFDQCMLYATDTQYQQNSLYKIFLNQEHYEHDLVDNILGSSIYYTSSEDKLFFSTATEPGDDSNFIISSLFSRTPGPGIQFNGSCLYVIDTRNFEKVEILFQVEKDWMPYRLGQFGAFVFPEGVQPQGLLFVYGVALKKFDDVCLVFELKD